MFANSELENNYKKNFTFSPSGISHSFDTGIAEAYGLEAAIVFNHLVYWLNFNKIKGMNQIQGRTWTFNTHEEMSQYLIYFTPRQIKYALEKLHKAGLIIKSKFNLNKLDHTNWYALADESLLKVSNNFYEKTKLSDRLTKVKPSMGQNCPIDETNLSDRQYKDNKLEDNTPSITPPIEKSAIASEVRTEKISDEKKSSEFPEAVKLLASKMLGLLEKYNPDYRPPKNLLAFLKQVNLLLKDEHTAERILQVLEWALQDNVENDNFKGWSSVIYAPNPAEKLRKFFAKIARVMTAKPKRKFAPCSDDAKSLEKMKEWSKSAI